MGLFRQFGLRKIYHKKSRFFFERFRVWLYCASPDVFFLSRGVALKIIQASLTGDNHELQILQWLRSQPRSHPGSRHIIEILDWFQLQGPNGTHEVIVTEVVVSLY